jgi:hypothetical protein
VGRSIKLISLKDTSKDFRIPHFGQELRAQIDDDCGQDVGGLVLRYAQNVLIDRRFIKLEYTNANQGIMPEAHNI